MSKGGHSLAALGAHCYFKELDSSVLPCSYGCGAMRDMSDCILTLERAVLLRRMIFACRR